MKKYIITTIIGLVFVALILISKDIIFQENAKDVIHILTDSFFVVGVVISGFGAIIFASNEGTFDMLAFGILKFFDLFKRDITKVKYRTFYDYRVERQQHKHGFGVMLIVGLGFLLVSVIFLLIYLNY